MAGPLDELMSAVQPMTDQIMANRHKPVLEKLMEGIGYQNGQWHAPGAADAINAALMAVPAARGFSPRLYHGTTRSSANLIRQQGFDVPSSGERAVFLTDAPKDALEFAYMKRGASPTNAKLVPGYVDESQLYNFNAKGEIYDPEMMASILDKARTAGAPGAKISNIQNFEHGAPSTTYAIIDPQMINVLRQTTAGSR